jgi:hypothetical protein
MRTGTVLASAVLYASVVTFCGLAHATVTTYPEDEAAFIAAAGPLTFESFESPISFVSVAPGGLDNLVDATFADVDVTCAAPSCVFAYGSIFPDDGVSDLLAEGLAGITFTFASPIKAFGIDTIGVGSSGYPTDISFVTADGTSPILSSIYQVFYDGVYFAGLTDTAGFDSLTIYGIDGVPQVINPAAYDSLRFSASLAGVPEPAAWLMMIVGVGGVGAVLRRRRRTAASPCVAV